MPGGILSKLFNKKDALNFSVLGTDMHSHFIPGIDDGSTSVEDTIEMLTALKGLGYDHFITTPHIQPELFPNTEISIKQQLELLQTELAKRGIEANLHAAAEYYVDESFLNTMSSSPEYLWFGDRFILIEVSMVSKFNDLEKVIFELMLKGYKVILAHVERYPYYFIEQGLEFYQSLRDKEVYLQVNLRSFTGNYGELQKKIARKLAEHHLIDFLGTDLHRPAQIKIIEESMRDDFVQKLLLNDTCLNKTL